MPTFRTNFFCRFPSVEPAEFFAVFRFVVVAPVSYIFVLFALNFIVHVLRGAHMVTDDEGAVNLVVALVEHFAVRNIWIQVFHGDAVVLFTIVKAQRCAGLGCARA